MPPYGTGASLYIRPVLVRERAAGGREARGRIPADRFRNAGRPLLQRGLQPDPGASSTATTTVPHRWGRDTSRRAVITARASISAEDRRTRKAIRACCTSTRKRKSISTSAAPRTSSRIRDGRYITPKSAFGTAVDHEHEPDDAGRGSGPEGGVSVTVDVRRALRLSSEAGCLRYRRRYLADREHLRSRERTTRSPTTTASRVAWCEKLYHKLRAIQYGEEPDTHGWMTVL